MSDRPISDRSTEEAHDSAGLEALLVYLQSTRGFDFTAYKRSSLQRRIRKRMQTLNLEQYGDFIDYLEVHPDEFEHLFNTILINVTDFFRDEQAWKALADEVIPRILRSKPPGEPVRLWSAGCASGQEAYSAAMLLCEAMGEDDFRRRVKIYATDVDAEALSEARLASYSPQQVEAVPPALRARYFEIANGRHVFRKDLRRSIIFGRHDLIQDAPISRVDLLICRNTLMYFNAEAQARILERFDFALNGGGYLFLGKAEVLLTRSHAFVPVDIKRRLFAKSQRGRPRERPLAHAERPGTAEDQGQLSLDRMQELAIELDPVAQILVDLNGAVTAANAQARALFGLTQSDLGQPLRELHDASRNLEAWRQIDSAVADHHILGLRDIEWILPNGEARYLNVVVIPLLRAGTQPVGLKLIFEDVTRFRRLQDELEHSQQELETANEELQSSNEELETTNEKRQSTVEELETTNEELQSTNEELETMNEELQSTNEELETANDELRQRSDEFNRLNAFLESILSSLDDGVVVLDSSLKVQTWNHRAEDLWGLRPEEVRGQSFYGLDIGLPVEQLLPIIRASLGEDLGPPSHSTQVAATNRRGRPIELRVIATRLTGLGRDPLGVILVMQEAGREPQDHPQPGDEPPAPSEAS